MPVRSGVAVRSRTQVLEPPTTTWALRGSRRSRRRLEGPATPAVWQVEIDPGTPATPHQPTRVEVFVVIEGEASVVIHGVDAVAHTGDAIVVPPDVDFALSNSGDEPVRLLCCLPVGGQAPTEDGGTFTPPWAE
jgi:mannose-6-phosphate isomerase-like protein (cupin superfamily)